MNLISKVAITSVATAALSMMPGISQAAQNLLWDWNQTTWNVNGSGWTDQFGVSQNFADGDNAYFASGKSTKNILLGPDFATGALTINATTGDIYDFSGGYSSGNYNSGKLTINNMATINLSGGAVVKFNGLASIATTSSINLEGNGTVAFLGSTSSVKNGTIYVGKNVTLVAGDKDSVVLGNYSTYKNSGGIGNTNIVNNGRIELWRGASDGSSAGSYTLDDGAISGSGEIHKYLDDTVTINKGIGYNTLYIHGGTVNSNYSTGLFQAVGKDNAGNLTAGASLVMYSGTTFNIGNQDQSIYGLNYADTVGTAYIKNLKEDGTNGDNKTVLVLRSVDGAELTNLRNIEFQGGNIQIYIGIQNETPRSRSFLWYEIGDVNVDNQFMSGGDGTRIGHFTTRVRVFQGKTYKTTTVGTLDVVTVDWSRPLGEQALKLYNGAYLEFGEDGVALGNSEVRIDAASVLNVNKNNISLPRTYINGDGGLIKVTGNNVRFGKLEVAGANRQAYLLGDEVTVLNNVDLQGVGAVMHLASNLNIMNDSGLYFKNDATLHVIANSTLKGYDGKTGGIYFYNDRDVERTINIDKGIIFTLDAAAKLHSNTDFLGFSKSGLGTFLVNGIIGNNDRGMSFNIKEGSVIISNTVTLAQATNATKSRRKGNPGIAIANGAIFDTSAWNATGTNGALSYKQDANWFISFRDGNNLTFDNLGTFIGDLNVDAKVFENNELYNFTNMANMKGNLNITDGKAKNLGNLTGNLSYTGGSLEGNVKSVKGNVTVGAVTLGNIAKIDGNLSLTGTTWNFDRSIGLILTGTATIDADSKIVLSVPGAKNGDLLFTAAGGAAGVDPNVVLEGLLDRQTGTVSVSGNNVILNIVNSDRKDLVWDWTKAAGTSPADTWNNALQSWTTTDTFVDEDYVTFNTAGAAKTINVAAAGGVSVTQMNLNPAVVTDDFTFTGNKITLLGDLRFNGAGKATLASVAFSANSVLSVKGGGELVLNAVDDVQFARFTLDGNSTISGSGKLKAGAYDLGNGNLNLVLQGTASVQATVNGALSIGAAKALGSTTVFLESGSITANIDEALGTGENVLWMGNGTTLNVNGHTIGAKRIILANGATGATVQNASATAGRLNIKMLEDTTTDMSGILFQDGTGGGSLTLSFESNTNSKIIMNTANTYSGGTYFQATYSPVYFGHGQAFGTGPLYLYGARVYATKTMTLANDIHVVKEDGKRDYPEIIVTAGSTLTLTGDLNIADGGSLRIRSNKDNSIDTVTVKFVPSASYVNQHGFVTLFNRVNVYVDTLGTAAGVTKDSDLPKLEFAETQTNLYLLDNVTIASDLKYTAADDMRIITTVGKTAVITGNIVGSDSSKKWINLTGGGTLRFSGVGDINGYQAKNTGFSLFGATTLILGNNDSTGNLNNKYGSADDAVPSINLKDSSTLVLNWSGDYEIKFRVQNEQSNGDIRKKGTGTALLARDMIGGTAATDVRFYVDEGSVIFGDSARYGATFTGTETSRPLESLQNYQYVQLASGTSITLDYARATDSTDTGEHKFLLPISGAGDLIVGSKTLAFNAIYNIAPKADTFTGKTTINEKNTLRVRSGSYLSSDVTVNAGGSIEYYATTDFADTTSSRLVHLTRLENRGTFKGNLMMESGSNVVGIGNIKGNVTLDGTTVAVDSAPTMGTAMVDGTLDIKNSSLSFRLGGLSSDPYDKLNVTGSIISSNNNILLVGLGGFTVGEQYTLITSGTGAALSGFGTTATAVGSRATFSVMTPADGSLIIGVLTGGADLTWAGTALLPSWNTTDTNWTGAVDQKFWIYDNVTFDSTAAEKAVVVDAGGVKAGKIHINESGYSFTGGSIAGELTVAADKSVVFNNSGVSFNQITFGNSSSAVNLGVSSDFILDATLIGAGILEKSGTHVLSLKTDNSAYTGVIKITAGKLDVLSNLGTATITLNGGTLTSSNATAISNTITLAADSSIDLGNAGYNTWAGSIAGTDTHRLTLTNGMLDIVGGSGTAPVSQSGPKGEVLKVSTLNLGTGAILNRPIAPASASSVVNVTDNVTFDTYGTIDLSEAGSTLALDVAADKKATSMGFISGTGNLLLNGNGTFSFEKLRDGGTNFQPISFAGTITVNSGTFEIARSERDNNKPVFGINTQTKIVINSGAVFATKRHLTMGRRQDEVPEITLTGATWYLGDDNFVSVVNLDNASIVKNPNRAFTDGDSIRAAVAPNGSPDGSSGTSTLNVTGGLSTIAVDRFTTYDGNWELNIDTGATLDIKAGIELNSETRTISVGGGGTVIFSKGTQANGLENLTFVVGTGSTLQVGNSGSTDGDIRVAKISNSGTVSYARNGDYDLAVTISGTGNLIKGGTGQMQITKTDTFTGLTTIQSGSVRLSKSSAGALASDVLVNAGALFNLTSYGTTAAGDGYEIGAKSGEGWSTTKQNVVLDATGSMTGKAIFGTGATLYSQGLTDHVVGNSGSVVGGTSFGNVAGTGSLVVNSGSKLAVGTMADPINGGAYTATIDNMSMGGSLTINGGSVLKLDLNNTTPASGLSDKVTYTGSLTITASATNRINLDLTNLNTGSTTGMNGTYVLFSGANTYTPAQLAGMANWFKYGRATFDFTQSSATEIKMIIANSEALTLTWAGENGGVWENSNESNAIWNYTPATASKTFFVNADTAIFDSTASGNTVTVGASGVAPKEMTVSGKDYTFSGTGSITTDVTGAGLKIDGFKATFNNANNAFSKVVLANNGTLVLGENQTSANYVISGTGNLEKSGTTTLDLSGTANTYTGMTTVSGGTVKIDALANINGTVNDITLNGGTLETAASLDLSNAGARSVIIGTNGGSINVGSTFTTVAKLGTLSGSLTKLGDGILQIQDNATLTKSVTITAGTLQAKGSKFASLNGAGTLDMNTSALRVQSGSFSGSFANLDKLVVGNVDSGTSSEKFTYSGGDITVSTTIEDGSTLEANVTLGSGKQLVAGSSSGVTTAIKGNLTLNTGSELYIAESDTGSISTGTVGTLKVEGNVSLSGANVHTSVSFGNAVDKIQATGKLTLDAANETNISFESDGSWGTNSYTLANFATLDIQGSADVADAFIVKGLTRKELTYIVTGTSISFTVASQAANWTWDNGSTNGHWDMFNTGTSTSASDNWDDNGGSYTPDSFAAGDNAKFTDNASGAINVWGLVDGSGNGAVNVNNVAFENTSGHDYSFSGGNLVANKITTSSTGNVTFGNAVTANQILVNGTGNLTLNGVGSKITEQMYVTNGTVTLGASGVLVDTKVMMDGSNGKLVNASGMTNTLSRLTGTTGTVDLTGSTLKVESGSYSGKVVGNSSSILEKSGNGGLTLSGLNTTDYQGALSVTGGTLTLNGTNTVSTFNTSAGASIVLGGNLTVGSGSSDGNISGSGNLTTKGNFGLGGSNSFSGSLIVESGTTTLNSATALSSSSGINVKDLATLDLNGNSISAAALSAESGATIKLNNANLTSSSNTDSQFAGNLIDNGMLIKDGSGKLTLSGANTFSGGLDINKGSVEVSDASNLGTGMITVKDTASLILNGSVSSTNTVSVSGKGTINTVNGSSTVDAVTLADSDSSFVKSGDGELILNNAMTLNGGKLYVNAGKLTSSSDLIINSGELLGGSGTVNSNVIVKSGGKVSPGNSIGQLTISGNATFEPDSLLDIEVSSLADANLSGISQSDRLTVDGLLTIDALTVNVLKSGSATNFTADLYKFLILEADSTALNIASLNVNSTDIVFTEDYTTTFVQEGNNIYMLMNINRPEYYRYADGENQANVAAYLDDGWNNADPFWRKTVTKEVRSNPGQVSAFLDQLSGYSLAHATQSRELAGEHFRQLWSQRLMAGIAAQPSLDKSTVNINPTEAASMAKFKDAESEMKESYWAQPFSYDTSMKSENHVKGYDYRANGVTVGFDTRFDTGMVMGAAFFYEDGNIDTKRSSDKTNINDSRFAVYGGWDEEDVSLIASVNYGIQQYDSKRYVNIGNLGGRNKADYDGNTYGASIDAALRVTKNIRAFAGFDWLNVSRESFHEEGQFAMDVSKETHDMLASRLGLRYDRYFGSFGVYGLVAWRHRFDDTASDLKGSYDGTPGSFKSNGLSNDPDSALLGLGGEYNFTPNYSIFADVNADLNSDHTELGLSAGLRYTW